MKDHVNSELISKVERYYNEKLHAFGVGPEGVDWKDEHSQLLRFDQLLKIIDTEPFSLNDLGCGYGALFLYLTQHTKYKISKYYGYDICSSMLYRANDLISDRRAALIQSDTIIYTADYSICSGVFNVKLDADIIEWEQVIKSVLYNLNKKSRKGFSFNCVTCYVDYKKDHLYYGDPRFYFDFCKRHFSRHVALLHDYGLYEFTILVRKEIADTID